MAIKDHLPLSETSFFILLSLAVSPKHGYAIIKEVSALSKERVNLATGTLYTALRRMLRAGLIERTDMDQPNGDNRNRKFYRLTPHGRNTLRAETSRLNTMLKLADELAPGDPR